MNELLLVGLGNPGFQYQNNRHNVGFLVLDSVADKFGVSFATKGESSFGCFAYMGRKVIFLKPQTFMNLSGKSVSYIANFYKLTPDNVIVIHDDLDLKFGTCKVKFAGSSGGHNGLKSIDSCISNQYWRFRIGIDRPANKDLVVSYVLGNLSETELEKIEDIAKKTYQNFEYLISNDKQKFLEKVR